MPMMMMVKIVDIILPGPPLVYMTGRAAVDLDQLSTVTMLVKLKTLIAHIAKILTLGFYLIIFGGIRRL